MMSDVRYALKLTYEQRSRMDVYFESEDFVHRWFHAKKIEHYEKTGDIYYYSDGVEMLNKLIKIDPKFSHLNHLPEESRRQIMFSVDKDFTTEQASNKCFPLIKERRCKKISLGLKDASINFDKAFIEIPQFKQKIHFNYHIPKNGSFKYCTLVKQPNNKYFLVIPFR